MMKVRRKDMEIVMGPPQIYEVKRLVVKNRELLEYN